MGKEDAININPENVYVSKGRGRDGIFGSFGGGLFGSLFGGIFDSFFGFEEEEEEYCDFTDADYRFINPKLRIIDTRKMIILNKNDLKKDNPDLKM